MTKIQLIKKYEKYPEYKDSGVEWLGQVPSSWGAKKIVSVFDFPNQKVTEATHEALSVTYDGIKKQLDNAAKVAEGSLRKYVRMGDIVINGRSDRKGAVGMSEYEGGVSLVYNVLRKRDPGTDPKYFHYLFRSKIFSEEFYRWGRGIVDDLWTTRESEMKRITITVPNAEEQKKIAKYLDEKTALIDAIIEKKQRLIELLQEKRTAIINHAVTKGLDPNVELVDSGVEWIGKIPKRWKIFKLKHFSKMIGGYAFDSNSYVEQGVLLVRITEVKDKISEADRKYIEERNWEDLENFRVLQGDMLVALTGYVGETSIFSLPEKAMLNQRVGKIITTSEDVSKKFIYYSTKQKNFQSFLTLRSKSSAQANVSNADVLNFQIALPALEEQEVLSQYLDEKISTYEDAVSAVNESIKKLVELKSSLISSVVTGKIKV
jgi:type I restriction enzyme S subunit